MSRLTKAAWIGGGLVLLADVGSAQDQGDMGPPGGMGGPMGGSRTGPFAFDQFQLLEPRYDAGAEYAKAIQALKDSRFKRAARFAEHVTEAAPSNPQGWRLLGAAYASDDNWRGSRRAYAKAVKLEPDDAKARAGLGLAMAMLSDASAREQLEWLRTRASVCGDTCPDAARLQTYTATVEGAMRASLPAAAPP